MKKWPLKFTIYADGKITGAPNYSKIEGARPVAGKGVEVPVFAHEIVRSEQKAVNGTLFTTEVMRIYAPVGYFVPRQRIGRSWDEMTWYIQGNAEDSNSNPWWSPGLAIYYAENESV